MSNVPSELKYTKDHEWIRIGDDGTAVVGVTDYAQECLGDVTFVELPPVGENYAAGDAFGVVESVKAASDLYMPVGAEILEVNQALEDAPELINSDPYGEGWIAKVKLSGDQGEPGKLLDADQYREMI